MIAEKSPLGLQNELKQKIAPVIVKLQQTLNIDEIKGLVNKLEEYKMENVTISQYINRLSGCIKTFDMEKISETLRQLANLVTK